MKRAFFLLINVILLAFLFETYSQNSVWLLNGKKLTIGNYELIQNEEDALIKYHNQKGKEKKLELLDIYSITSDSGDETIFHKEDYFVGAKVSEKELGFFVEGQYDARMNYKDNFALISSFPIGFVSIFYPPFSKVFFFPVYPSAYVGILGLTGPQFEQIMNEKPAEEVNKYYILGYKEAAKRKRIKNGIVGAGAGVLAGVAVAFLIVN